MRRLNNKTKARLIRKSKTSLKRHKKARNFRLRKWRAIKKQGSYKPSHRLVAPRVFDIGDTGTRRELVEFLTELRHHYTHRPDEPLLIDFHATAKFSATGTLLFYAELCRLIEYSKGRVRLRCNEPANSLASQVLQQIGVYQLCSHSCHWQPTHSDVVHWRVAQGHVINASLYAHTIEAHEGRLAEPLVEGVFRGLSEAMANAVEHAYIDVREDGLGYSDIRDWWVFSQVKEGYLSVALCDLGVGIPKTLPIKRPGLIEAIKIKIGITPTDGDCIAAAVEDSRSRTGLRERGKGLGNIIDAAAACDDGVAAVFSNRGYYIFNKDGANWSNYRDSILGTIVIWRIQLTDTESHDN